MSDHDLVGWYRNPTGGVASLRVPYRAMQFDKSMYPDLILFHRTEEGIKPSIVDPHGYHLADAASKLKGLANYAAQHGDLFERIHSVVEIEGKLLALDLKADAVHDAIRTVGDGDVRELFERHAGNYS
nr:MULTISPECIES: hypothetical protein [unclassified Rhodococcus (in: high G+C Gram-positive bacteria)]